MAERFLSSDQLLSSGIININVINEEVEKDEELRATALFAAGGGVNININGSELEMDISEDAVGAKFVKPPTPKMGGLLTTDYTYKHPNMYK